MSVMVDPATALPNRIRPRHHGLYLTVGLLVMFATIGLGSVLGIEALRNAGEDRGNVVTVAGPAQAIVLGQFTLQLGRIPSGFEIVHTGYASSKGVFVDGKLTDGAPPASDEGKVVLQHVDTTDSGSASADTSSNLTIRAVPASFLSEAGAKQFAGPQAKVVTLSDGKRIVISPPPAAGAASRDIVWIASNKVTVSLSGQGVGLTALEQVVSGMVATSSQ
ncbi:MAG: hypothetical protein JWL73_3183 [Actinomycetia bacterium]|nr:hypothetical protein [Actinomycetes bacterium]